MQKCYLCEKDISDSEALSSFNIEFGVNDKIVMLGVKVTDQKGKGIRVCQKCCATGLFAAAKELLKGEPGKTSRIM